MTRKFLYTLLAVVGSSLATQAQVADLPLLLLGHDAATASLGQVKPFTPALPSMYSDPTSLFATQQQFAASYTVGMRGKSNDGTPILQALSVGYRYGSTALWIGARTFGGHTTPIINDSGIRKGLIRPNDRTLDLTIAQQLAYGLSASLQISFMQSYNGRTANLFTSRLGLHHRTELSGMGWHSYAAIAGLGTAVRYGGKQATTTSKQPLLFSLGTALSFLSEKQLTVGIALDQLQVAGSWVGNYSLGARYGFLERLGASAGFRFAKGYNAFSLGCDARVAGFVLGVGYEHATVAAARHLSASVAYSF